MGRRGRASYPVRVSLLACPFCRELFTGDEAVETCPDCGLVLRPIERLPPTTASEMERPAVAPEDVVRAWSDGSRGRGLLVCCSVAGLLLFFAPWVTMTLPEAQQLSGFDLARAAASWLWAGAVGWFVLLPLAFTRRTIHGMRGVRVVSALLASLTWVDVALLCILPATRGGHVPVEFSFAWGTWASAAVSLVATVAAIRFGGPRPTRVGSSGAVSERRAAWAADGQALAEPPPSVSPGVSGRRLH